MRTTGADAGQNATNGSSWTSSLIPSAQTTILFGAIVTGLTLIGATTYFVATRYLRNKSSKRSQAKEQREESEEESEYVSEEEEDLNEQLFNARQRRSARRNVISSQRSPPLITFAELFEQALYLQHQRLSQRKARIYFDANDEYYREEQLPELLQSNVNLDGTYEGEDEQIKQKRIQDTICVKYSPVSVFFGNEDYYNSGTTRITRNIFAGTSDRTENAILFLDNLNKIKQTKNQIPTGKQNQLRKLINRDQHDAMLSQASYPTQLADEQASDASGGAGKEFNSDSGFESLDPVYEDQNSVDEDEVLLNISPNKYEKPKDQLYMDFFVKYTEIFVKEQQQTGGPVIGNQSSHRTIDANNK